MRPRLFLPALCVLLLPATAPAPIYGGFENLNTLINEAEFVVVAKILKSPPMPDFGNGGTFEIQVEKVLKGDVKEGKRATAYLRDLYFDIRQHEAVSLTHGFLTDQLYLLFLNKPGAHIRDADNKPLPVDFENANSSGDAVWISPPSGNFDLDSLKGKSIREAVIAVLTHTATEQRKFAVAVDAMIERRSSEPLVQRVTQVIWFEKKAEEAAALYCSVFKRASKDPNVPQYRDAGPEVGTTFAGVKIWLDGQELVLVNGGQKFNQRPPASLTVNCETQEEIDEYWEKLSAGGEKLHAGWLKDRFGIFWHVVPQRLAMMLGTTERARSDRVMNAMLKMEKLDSEALWRAFVGE
jgi:predicted 3-demethylubiquinone-9 3-methyltransferase (glyoxalase superfamily)